MAARGFCLSKNYYKYQFTMDKRGWFKMQLIHRPLHVPTDYGSSYYNELDGNQLE